MSAACITMHIPIINELAPRHGCTFNRSYAISSATFRCNAAKPFTHKPTTSRRSGNYEPPLWDFHYIQLLSSEYAKERYSTRATELMEQVKILLLEEEAVGQLELIDDLQRLAISYHFQAEINQILNRIHFDLKYYYGKINLETADEIRDLYSTALGFRLLRDHGFKVSQEVFDCFKNDEGSGFKVSSLGDSTKGLLQLYEASFLLTQGEQTLDIAREFSSNLLHKKVDDGIDEEYLLLLMRGALELPIHWSARRPNARWFIDVYAKRPDMNPVVLELAKLDFNIVQATHQQELKHVSRWWKQTGLAEKLPFARDRVVECYFWTCGLFEPPYGYSRIMSTKVNVLITIIDDIFDVYATLEEIMLFNDTIQRWDLEALDQLPNYMQMCFLALNNFVNEMAYDVLKEQGAVIIPILRKSWADLCRAYTQEAEWYWRGHTPRVEEYMKNAWISISAPTILWHAFFLITNPIEKEVVRSLYEYPNIVRCSGMLLRLANDLGTSRYEMKRGDVPKSAECYMNESGASREEAREYVRYMIRQTWKEMNQERNIAVAECGFSQKFVTIAVDLGRMAQYMYQHGDGHGIQNPQIKDRISTLLFQPIIIL